MIKRTWNRIVQKKFPQSWGNTVSCSCPLPPLPAPETAEQHKRWRPETPRQSVQAPRPEYTDWIRLKSEKLQVRAGQKHCKRWFWDIYASSQYSIQECCNLDRTTRNIANVTYIHYFGNIVPSKVQGNKNVQKPEEFAPYLVFLFSLFKAISSAIPFNRFEQRVMCFEMNHQ